MAASSSVVIKVKYGDTLRRFNAQISCGQLNMTMDGLKNKILSLFSFEPNTELILTYVDEDDDVVTLADDDDLHDVVRQDLDPLRITVKVNAGKSGLPTRPSASSSPLDHGVSEILKSLTEPLNETLTKLQADLASKESSFERVKKSLQSLNTDTSNPKGTVPEPLRENIEKLSADLASETKLLVDLLTNNSSSAPGIDGLVDHLAKLTMPILDHVDHFTKLSMPFLDLLSKLQPGVNSSSTEKGVSGNNEGLPKTKPAMANNDVKTQSVNGATMESSKNSDRVHPQSDFSSPRVDKEKILLKKLADKVDGEANLTNQTDPIKSNAGKGVGSSTSSNVPFFVNNSGSDSKVIPKPASVAASDSTNALLFDAATSSGFGKNAGPIWVPHPSPGGINFPNSFTGGNPMCEGPFSGMVTGTESSAPPLPASEVDPFKKRGSQNYYDYSGNIFHRGIRCDGCGAHPITGPRFKSKVKVNYDLCRICFEKMGNDSDYNRIDRPTVYRHNMSLKGLNEARARCPAFQQVHKIKAAYNKVKPGAYKVDSCFITDVNIFDGTVMAPLTPFTKIWRMRNNGMVVWPKTTKLVWIGGDKLSNELVADVPIPTDGVMMNQELEVAVDFISPKLPGRYISYWRMALPCGQKFGQRIWVLIQVDPSLEDTPPHENVRNLNLNLPPGNMIGPEIINVDPQPVVEDGPSGPVKPIKMEELSQQPNTDQELKFPINNSLLVGDGASSSHQVSYPIINLTDVMPDVQSMGPTGTYPVQEQKIEDELKGKMDVENKLLKELEVMGFKEIDLNRKMLRVNEYDLGQAVDDLCGVAEWDPILEELQEMGFSDTATNKMLLKKNNGSIKRVVMDLIAGEKME